MRTLLDKRILLTVSIPVFKGYVLCLKKLRTSSLKYFFKEHAKVVLIGWDLCEEYASMQKIVTLLVVGKL